MSIPVRISVAKESLGFSAAHFLTLPGHVCERLHGHNYRVSATVEGEVDPETGFVMDFAVLKRALRRLVEPMDHRVLIPAKDPRLVLREDGDALVVDYERPGWLSIPRAHACLLPLRHTTAELLAQYLSREALAALTSEGARGIRSLTIEVEESTGQWATARCDT